MKLDGHILIFSTIVLFHLGAVQADLAKAKKALTDVLRGCKSKAVPAGIGPAVENYKRAFGAKLKDFVKGTNKAHPGVLDEMLEDLDSVTQQIEECADGDTGFVDELLMEVRVAAFQVALKKAGAILEDRFAEKVVKLLEQRDEDRSAFFKQLEGFVKNSTGLKGDAQDLESLVAHSGILKDDYRGKRDPVQALVQGHLDDARKVVENKAEMVKAYYMLDEALKMVKPAVQEESTGWSFGKAFRWATSSSDSRQHQIAIQRLTTLRSLAKTLLQVALKAGDEPFDVVSDPTISRFGEELVVHAKNVGPETLFLSHVHDPESGKVAAAILRGQAERFRHPSKPTEKDEKEALRWFQYLVDPSTLTTSSETLSSAIPDVLEVLAQVIPEDQIKNTVNEASGQDETTAGTLPTSKVEESTDSLTDGISPLSSPSEEGSAFPGFESPNITEDILLTDNQSKGSDPRESTKNDTATATELDTSTAHPAPPVESTTSGTPDDATPAGKFKGDKISSTVETSHATEYKPGEGLHGQSRMPHVSILLIALAVLGGSGALAMYLAWRPRMLRAAPTKRTDLYYDISEDEL